MYIYHVRKRSTGEITCYCLVSIKHKDVINRPITITSISWGKEKRSHVSKTEWYLERPSLKRFVRGDDMIHIQKNKMILPIRISFNSPQHFHAFIIPYQLNFPFRMHEMVKLQYELWFNKTSLSIT